MSSTIPRRRNSSKVFAQSLYSSLGSARMALSRVNLPPSPAVWNSRVHCWRVNLNLPARTVGAPFAEGMKARTGAAVGSVAYVVTVAVLRCSVCAGSLECPLS